MDDVVEDTRAGPVIRIRVRTRADRDGVDGVVGGALRVVVRSAPERGKANRVVVRTVAAWLGVPAGTCTLASGGSTRDKRILVSALDADAIRARISGHGGSSA